MRYIGETDKQTECQRDIHSERDRYKIHVEKDKKKQMETEKLVAMEIKREKNE